jgi:hypothetical protein
MDHDVEGWDQAYRIFRKIKTWNFVLTAAGKHMRAFSREGIGSC